MNDSEAVNPTAVETLFHDLGDDRAFMAQVIDEYLTSVPQVLEGMRAAVLANQPANVALLAHKLKSSSAWLGADRLLALCQEMELSARKGILDGADEDLQLVETEVRRVDQALRSLAARL